ncbi:MAG: ABC transporter permease [Candidatus Portnoybacteria bacterium]|nr:ABC transporter permease [Candidatus Portnoybacteria bacterium]MDD4983146.1 ABC transporter permease [Candidatus Portnoybacteria bacterium]
MRFFQIIKNTKNNLSLNKTRTFLTMLGIIIGVAAVIAIVSVGAGAQELLLAQVKAMGSNLIGILPGASDDKGPPAAVFGIEVTTLKYDDALEIRKLPDIVAICAYVTGRGTVGYFNQNKELNYTGVLPEYLTVEDTAVAKGRFIKQEDNDNMARNAVLGSKAASDIFGQENPLEKQIKINQITFKVVGVMTERGASGLQNQDEQVFIPLKIAQKIMLGIDHVAFIRAKVDKEANIEPSIGRVKDLLRFRHRIKDASKDDFSVRSTAQALDILGSITQALKMFLAAVAAISLVVGGIGIMNIMFVTVSERTGEIGLRKAVGAKRKDILLQFLVESAVMTSFGGLIGVALGLLISAAIALGVNYFGYDWKLIVAPLSIFWAVFMAAGVGLVFGLWPANRASLMSPMEALRKQ